MSGEDLTYGGDASDPEEIREDVKLGADVEVPADIEERLAREREEGDEEGDDLDG